MAKTDHDARLIYSASESDANMLWATRFFAPDPFVFVEARGRRCIVVSDLELDRAKRQAAAYRVLPYSKFFRRLQKQGRRVSSLERSLPDHAVPVPHRGTFVLAPGVSRGICRGNARAL